MGEGLIGQAERPWKASPRPTGGPANSPLPGHTEGLSPSFITPFCTIFFCTIFIQNLSRNRKGVLIKSPPGTKK